MAVIGVLGLLAGVGGGVLIATSGHFVHPLAYGLQIAVMMVGAVGAGLYWAVARPGNRISLLLLAYAVVVAGVSLQGAASPLLHSIGVLFDPLMFILGWYLVFVFPFGRLVGALEKVLLAGTAWIALASFLPWFFFSSVVFGGAPLARCNASCPENALMIADRPAIANGFGTTEQYLLVLVLAAIAAGLSYRLASASRPRRRALLPVYVPGFLLVIPFGLFVATELGLIDVSPNWFDTMGWFWTAGLTFLAFGFLLAIVQAVVFAGIALRKILGRLYPDENAVHLRELLASALDDPPLQLAVEVGRGSKFFVDSRGDPIDVARVRRGRSATALERRGETVAYILHDAALDTDPELMQIAGQSVLLALESGRLEAELRSQTAELRASRGRVAAASERERRKIERDLHDGAQQRLMAIQIKLALLRERVDDPGLASEFDEIGEDATAAVRDLRGLAHGIYPTVLRERGLGDGLRSFAKTAPIHIEVVDAGIGRCAPPVESAVYFCSLEAIQNVMKHGGSGARVTVTLDRRRNDIEFVVEDDGVGFDSADSEESFGLMSMRDRIAAVGGELEIVSAPGAGSSIRGIVPAGNWRAPAGTPGVSEDVQRVRTQ